MSTELGRFLTLGEGGDVLVCCHMAPEGTIYVQIQANHILVWAPIEPPPGDDAWLSGLLHTHGVCTLPTPVFDAGLLHWTIRT